MVDRKYSSVSAISTSVAVLLAVVLLIVGALGGYFAGVATQKPAEPQVKTITVKETVTVGYIIDKMSFS